MTELYAFGSVGTALGKTRKLLLENADAWLWAKLVLITFFVALGAGMFNPGSNMQFSMNRADLNNLPTYDYHHALSDSTILAIIIVSALLLIALGLIFSYLRAVFSFVLVDAVTTGNVHVVRPFKENLGRGFKVFLFNIVVGIVSLIVIGGTILAGILAILWALGGSDLFSENAWDSLSTGGILAVIGVVLAALLIIGVYTILIGLIVGFFYDFGIPLMFFKGMGFRQAAREVCGLVRRQPVEFLVYVITRWVLEAVIDIFLGIIFLFVFAIFLAAGLIAVIAMAGAATISVLLAVPFAIALVIGLLLLVVIVAVISMPVQVYLRYFSLDFFRKIDPSAVLYAERLA